MVVICHRRSLLRVLLILLLTYGGQIIIICLMNVVGRLLVVVALELLMVICSGDIGRSVVLLLVYRVLLDFNGEGTVLSHAYAPEMTMVLQLLPLSIS